MCLWWWNVFCRQNYWNIRHPLSVYCTSISTLPTFQCSICASPHQSMVDYTGHFLAYAILSFCRFFSSYECKNDKLPTGCGVSCQLYQKMPKLVINYELVSARPLFRLNPQPQPLYFILIRPKRCYFCDKINCPIVADKNASIHTAKKHLASCATCKTGISTLSLRINEHPYWIKLCYVQSTDTGAQITVCKLK